MISVKHWALASLVLFAALTASVHSTIAQDMTAEVRTWKGATWQVTQPTFEVYFTVMPSKAEEPGAQPPQQPGTTPAEGTPARGRGVELFGSAQSLSQLFDKGLDARGEQRSSTAITLSRDGAEARIPLASIDALLFGRQPVLGSTLPSYFASTHYRHSATVVMRDGTRLEADYVNLGTAVLRGTTPHGRVDIPWAEVEFIRFRR